MRITGSYNLAICSRSSFAELLGWYSDRGPYYPWLCRSEVVDFQVCLELLCSGANKKTFGKLVLATTYGSSCLGTRLTSLTAQRWVAKIPDTPDKPFQPDLVYCINWKLFYPS